MQGSGVEVLNLLCGGVGFVYKSSDEAERLFIGRPSDRYVFCPFNI